jgi:PTH1 family peptidyl-tRNA hydrolase
MEHKTPYIIVGLGNPGGQYEKTYHNVGFKTIEALGERQHVKFKLKRRCYANLAEVVLGSQTLVLAMPQTFMNESGLAVSALMNWYKVLADSLIVIYDDMDLEPGQIRIRKSGRSGGHRGMESIIRALETNKFTRIRIGIGRPPGRIEGEEYVLSNIVPARRKEIEQAIILATEAVEEIIKNGVDTAMNKYNR